MPDAPAEPPSHRGRLRERASAELAAAGFRDENDAARRLGRGLSLSDLAHVVALVEAGELDAQVGARVLAGLLELHEIPEWEFPWNPQIGDPFNCREHELAKRVGAGDAGWLSAGRPRREALRVALRITARDGVLRLHDALLDAADALHEQATRHAHDLAADYTYLQPAQPATIGHLLLAYQQPLLRDLSRLRSLYAWLDRSVAGVGGTAGSRWAIDRERLADLLGFGGLELHTRDAMWQTDGYVQLLADVAIAMTGLSQLAQDLEVYGSGEFGFVELSDAHSRESALMPQKKNPYALVVVRTHAGSVAGSVGAALATLHTGSARTDHFQLLNGVVPQVLEDTVAVVTLAAQVLRQARFDAERWARAAHDGMVVAADLADVLSHHGLDYRAAHTVVGQALRGVLDSGRAMRELTLADLQAAAANELGTQIDLDEQSLRDALDPQRCVEQRPQAGSCSPERMRELLQISDRELEAARDFVPQRRTLLADAERVLLSRATELASR